MNKRVFLPGGAGSIGIHTLDHIMVNTDWDVICVDSFRHKGWTDRIRVTLENHPQWKERVTVLMHDLTAPLSPILIKKIGHIDYVIAMASLSDVQDSIENPVPFIQNNVALMTNLLEYAREVKPEVFLLISTDEVYGASGRDYRHPEWSPIVPSNPYSASKACQEAIAISYWRTYNVPLIITNTMNNWGEMQQGNKFPAMLQKWIEKGETVTIHGTEGDVGTRYYIHSRNHADALLYILQNLPPYLHQPEAVDKPDRYNIVGDKQLSNLELAQLIAKLMGKELKFKYKLVDFHSGRPGHDKHYGLDGSKLASKGWKSPIEFEESLRKTIEWQRKHPEWIE